MKKDVFSFKEAGTLAVDQLDGKASNLLWLRKHGFNVPDGFCLISNAYQDHLWQFQVNINDPAADLKKIRNLIFERPIDSTVAAQIETYYQALSSPVVAVRSSATAEDLPEHSFAGQYETCLNVKTFAECLEAVKKCWASVWTERAYHYRQKNNIDHTQVKMTVIVQQQIPADVAGVMFTADPLRGKTDRIVIEACRGLGEALVSGRVTPDEIIFAKKNLKPIWILPADLNEPVCLNTRIERRLARAGRKIENLCRCPQDIEWAVQNNQIYFLQTRPITTQPIEQPWEDRQIWTNLNTGEIAPDVVTPLDMSILKRFLMPLFGNLFWILSIEIGKHPLIDIAAGRLYFNFNTGMAFITKLPSFLMKPQKTEVLFGGGDKKQYDLRKINFGPDDLPDLKVSMWKILWRAPYTLGFLFTRRYSQALKILEQMKQNSRHYGSVSFSSMSAAQLLELLTEIFERAFSKLDLLYLVTGLMPMPVVVVLCKKWFKDENRVIANSLLKAGGGMDDVQAGLALVELARLGRQDAEVCEIIQAGQHWESVQRKLQESEVGRRFIEAWDRFMDRHGHHCRSEIFLYNQRWSEKPNYVLGMVKGCLGETSSETPGQRYERQVKQQAEVIDQTLRQLENPAKRWVLRKLVKRVQRGLAFRENMKSEIVRLLATVRQIIMTIGQRMRESELIKETKDIFFLEFEELKPVIEGRVDFDIAQTIRERRVEYERYKVVDPPQVIVGKFDPDSYIPRVVDTDISVFHGMSACPGKVTAKARVILRTDEEQQVLPGEILVAPFTDPGWTPYFVNAAAIVMDQGGLLSHGSIVAREYGIPAVVNVGPATKIIKTGQLLEVDANQGIVRILS